LLSKLGISPPLLEPLSKVICGLYEVFRKYDARSVEINPLVLTGDGRVYAADCHIVIDEASVFRHPDLGIDYPRDIGRAPTELEQLAWEIERKDYRGVGYFVQMTREFRPGEGVVGFHGIGGGGAMLGADALIRHGVKLANYADTSGNPTAAKVYRIVKLIFSQPNIDGYVLMGACIANQEQWHHAHALVRALREELVSRPNFPVIILIAGNKETESLEILSEGLRGLPAKVEIYGRDYVYNVDYIAERMKKLIEEYRSN
jgi:succinyl-CoA synthetase beta subunit